MEFMILIYLILITSFKFTYFNGNGSLYPIFTDAQLLISFSGGINMLQALNKNNVQIYINWNYLKKNNNLLM
jgi:xanthine dehydrogenase molybdopterin-binding subunit B